MVKAKKTGSRVRMMFSNKDSSSHTEPKGCCPYQIVVGNRLEIFQKIYTSGLHKSYTLKMHELGLFLTVEFN